MTVRSKIMLACLLLAGICGTVGFVAWRGQSRLSGLAVDLYDQSFVAQDFLGRADRDFETLAIQVDDNAATGPERQQAVATIGISLDIVATQVSTTRTAGPLAHLRAAILALPGVPAARMDAALAAIRDEFAHVAHRLSNHGLAQRDEAEALAAFTRRLLMVVLGAAFAGVTATGWLLVRNVVPPLRQAASDMTRLCWGEVDGLVGGTGRGDEIGDLCRSIGVFRQALIDNRLYDLRFRAALDNMTQGLCLFDEDGRLVVHNRQFAAMFGTPAACNSLAAFRTDPRLGAMFQPLTLNDTGGPAEHFHDLADGRAIRVSSQAMPGAGLVATYEDVTERRRWQEQLSHMACHDALTGLPNRTAFRERIEQVLLQARPGTGAAVLYLDLDGFKTINDTLGHPVGDELLRAVAARLRECVRATDLVARLGGDEFAIIRTNTGELPDFTALCDRAVAVLRAPFHLNGHTIVVGTSIGLALADAEATADGLLRSADIALYCAKADGRGTWRQFVPEMDSRLQARHALEMDLLHALEAAEFTLHYQPLINAQTSVLSGFEALVRWNHPRRGVILPAEFIPLAEQTGLIKAMGAWILRQACADAAQWPAHVQIAVNLSPAQFQTGGHLIRDVEQAIAEAGLAPCRLELEITESVLLQNNSATLETLHHLRRLGVRISMDDFGTGYSSLSYLRQFPFDKIKIDQSFVRSILTDTGSIEIIRAVIGLGRALHIDVLAEGVETAEQLKMLQAEGCHEIQGFFFSEPRPAADLPLLIAQYSGACPGSHPAKPQRQTSVQRQLEYGQA